MDFTQAVYELHRRYITTALAECIEDQLAIWGADPLVLEVMLPVDILEAARNVQARGCLHDPILDQEVPTANDTCTNARHSHRFTPSLREDAGSYWREPVVA